MIKKVKKETETKKAAAVSINKKQKNKQNKTNLLKRIFNYFKEMKSELKKVVWPTKKGVLNGTLTVFVMVIIIMLIVMSADFVFNRLLRLLLGIS